MFKRLSLVLAATCLAGFASADPAVPDSVADLLRSMDSTDVVIEWVDDTVARIDANRNGYNFTVRLMDCGESGSCVSSLAFAAFDMEGTPVLADYQKINEYNDGYPFGRAFLIEAPGTDTYTVGVDYSFSMADENNFGESEVNLFFLILDSFIAHMQDES